jgi:hypothetical protein
MLSVFEQRMQAVQCINSTTANVSNISFTGSQEDWTAANGLSIDGSSTTEFSSDYPNIQIDVNANDNLFKVSELVAWIAYIQTTEDGIRNFYGAVTGIDTANWVINTSIIDLYLDNVNSDTVTQEDSIILMRSDKIYPQVKPTSGGGGIGMIQSGSVFVTETGVSGLTPTESAKLNSIANDVWDVDISTKTTGAAKVLKDAEINAGNAEKFAQFSAVK